MLHVVYHDSENLYSTRKKDIEPPTRNTFLNAMALEIHFHNK